MKKSITVAGGTGPKLPPIPTTLDGTPDPGIAQMVREGAARYHLEALAGLAAEERAAKRFVDDELARPAPSAIERTASATELLRSIGIR